MRRAKIFENGAFLTSGLLVIRPECGTELFRRFQLDVGFALATPETEACDALSEIYSGPSIKRNQEDSVQLGA